MIDRQQLHELRLQTNTAESVAELSAVVSRLIELLEKSEAVDTVPLLSCTCGVDEHNELCPTHGSNPTDRPSPTEGVRSGQPMSSVSGWELFKTLRDNSETPKVAACIEELERRYNELASLRTVSQGGVALTSDEVVTIMKFLKIVFSPSEIAVIAGALRQ